MTILGGPDRQARADRILRDRGSRREVLDALTIDERTAMSDDYLKMHATRPANPLEDADFVAMAEKRQREYDATVGLDRLLDMEEPETGRGTFTAACADLRSRGVNPDDATQQQLLDALVRVSS
jgi:hypothetical protein